MCKKVKHLTKGCWSKCDYVATIAVQVNNRETQWRYLKNPQYKGINIKIIASMSASDCNQFILLLQVTTQGVAIDIPHPKVLLFPSSMSF